VRAHIGDFDVMLNCISFSPDNPVLIRPEDLQRDITLSVISDISCYPGPYNPIPLYDSSTRFEKPCHTLDKARGTLDVIAIENLPSQLALEASQEFARELFPHLQHFLASVDRQEPLPPEWQKSAQYFYRHVQVPAEIKDLGHAIGENCFDPTSRRFDRLKALGMIQAYVNQCPLNASEQRFFRKYLAEGMGDVFLESEKAQRAFEKLVMPAIFRRAKPYWDIISKGDACLHACKDDKKAHTTIISLIQHAHQRLDNKEPAKTVLMEFEQALQPYSPEPTRPPWRGREDTGIAL
jgi:hypothetical protein